VQKKGGGEDAFERGESKETSRGAFGFMPIAVAARPCGWRSAALPWLSISHVAAEASPSFVLSLLLGNSGTNNNDTIQHIVVLPDYQSSLVRE
jgi:hypothetical protein